MQTIQMHLFQKEKYFSQFLVFFFKSALNFQHLKKKISLMAYVFRKLRTLKNVVK